MMSEIYGKICILTSQSSEAERAFSGTNRSSLTWVLVAAFQVAAPADGDVTPRQQG